MEKINEQYGEGNAYDFGARIYDPRIGRWYAIDPQGANNPGVSPYAFVRNSPLIFVDPDGNTEKWYVTVIAEDGTKAQFEATDESIVAINQYMGTEHFMGKEYDTKYWGIFDIRNDVVVDYSQGGESPLISYNTSYSLRKGEGGYATKEGLLLSRAYENSILNSGIKVWGSGGADEGSKTKRTFSVRGKTVDVDLTSEEWEAMNTVFEKMKTKKGPRTIEKGPKQEWTEEAITKDNVITHKPKSDTIHYQKCPAGCDNYYTEEGGYSNEHGNHPKGQHNTGNVPIDKDQKNE